jgi:hypothetical protein
MKKNVNVTTIIESTTTLEGLKNLVNDYNANVMDGLENELVFDNLVTICDNLNEDERIRHTIKFLNDLETDRKTAFANLLEKPCYNKISVKVENDGTITVSDPVAVVNSVVDIEKYFRRIKSTKVSPKNGKVIPDDSITIFGKTRFYGLLEKFIQNLVINNVEGENLYKTDLTRLKLDEVTFTENDGKAFDSTSATALDKQMRVLAKFFGDNDIKTKKKDIMLLRTQVIKAKFRTDMLHLDFAESKVNAFLTTLYKYFISVYNKHETALTNSNGKVIYNITESKAKKPVAVETENK